MNAATQTTEKPLQGEQAADLAALEASAREGEQAAQLQANGGEALPEKPPLADELAGLMAAAVAGLSPAFPSLKKIYTPEVVRGVSAAVAAVCEKREWLQDGAMGGWGEEIVAVAMIAPLAIATHAGIKADLAARKGNEEGKPAEKPESPYRQPGSNTVSFGAVLPAAPAGEGKA